MFRAYQTSLEFLQDNRSMLQKDPLQTVFFEENARNMPQITDRFQGFAVKIEQDGKTLLAARRLHFPMVLYGDSGLCGPLSEELAGRRLLFRQVLAAPELAQTFLICYMKAFGGTFRTLRLMDIMYCRWLNPSLPKEPEAETPGSGDLPALAALAGQFHREALGEAADLRRLMETLQRDLLRYRAVRRQGEVVSIAKKAREGQELCAVSNVYTHPAFRGQGLARQVVSSLTREILAQGKLPYLYVDQRNPISNRLYQRVGYVYHAPQGEYLYTPPGRGEKG